MRNVSRCLVATVAIAALLSGCGDSKKTGTASTTKAPSRSSTTTSTVGNEPSTTLPSEYSPTPTTAPTNNGTCGPQFAVIDEAIKGSDNPVLAGAVGTFVVVDCRLSPSIPIWAAANTSPKPGAALPRQTIVVQRIGAIWTVEVVGTGPVGCNIAQPIPTELLLAC